MLPLLSTLSPNAAVLILTAGLALIAFELNRPGSILPGAVGLLFSLLAAASLAVHHPDIWAVIGSSGSIVLFLFQTKRPLHLSLLVALMVLLVGCLSRLVPRSAGGPVNPTIAAMCGTFLAAGTTVLTRIARRARRNKGLD